MLTVVQQLEAAQARITALEADAKSTGEKLVAAEGQVKQLTEANAAQAKAHEEALAKVKADAEKAAVTAKAESEKLAASLTAMTAERDERDKKLASPAYKLANAAGDKGAVVEGGTPADAPGMTQAQALEAYRKLDGNGEAQKAFRVAHWKLLGINEEK
jgi:seryl-tRNA synthetase